MDNTLDIVIASSRGRGLEDIIIKQEMHPSPQNFMVIFSPGARLKSIITEARSIRKAHPRRFIHFYILGGYCDTSSRISQNIKNKGFYEEFIFREDPESAASRVAGLFREANTALSTPHTKHTFCTIPPSDLLKWNKTRLQQKKTCTLKYTEEEYTNMQKNLNKAIVLINGHIMDINKENQTHTPKLADSIMKKKGKGKGFKLYADRLVDGVHPTTGYNEKTKKGDPKNNTLKRWAEQIVEAIVVNRAPRPSMTAVRTAPLSESDPESDSERPYKRPKFNLERKL